MTQDSFLGLAALVQRDLHRGIEPCRTTAGANFWVPVARHAFDRDAESLAAEFIGLSKALGEERQHRAHVEAELKEYKKRANDYLLARIEAEKTIAYLDAEIWRFKRHGPRGPRIVM